MNLWDIKPQLNATLKMAGNYQQQDKTLGFHPKPRPRRKAAGLS